MTIDDCQLSIDHPRRGAQDGERHSVDSAVYISLGSNIGDREATLRRALKLLDCRPGLRVTAVSSMIETRPVGGPAGQSYYLNAAAKIETELGPLELLEALQEVEAICGRNRATEQRWGPRTCDLDILLMGDKVMDSPELTIPHPWMHQRLFVLRPLAEIAPQAVHPVLHKTVAQLLADLGEQHRAEAEGGTK